MFMFPRWPPSLHYDANCIRWPDRRVRNIGRNEKRFSFAHEMVDDAIALPNAHLDIAFELVKIFLRIDEMKIVPCVRTFDYHHEKVAAVVKVAVAHRRFEFIPVLLNPAHQVDCWLDGACALFFTRWSC